MTQLVKPVCALTEAIKPLLPPLLVQVADHRVLEGFLKYGQTLSDNHKPLRKKVVHHIQELLDALNYNEWELMDLGDPDSHFELMFQVMGRRSTYIKHLRDLLALVPDLTFEELTYKEGHSEADRLRADLAAAQARVAELETENAALRTDCNHAAQALIYAIQKHPDGDVGQDWSSWRVGYSRGVYRGYGRTDVQQLTSAVCMATAHPDPYAPEGA